MKLANVIPFVLLAGLVSPSFAQNKPKPELPKVVLIGDSIRLGYAPLVAKRLEGRAVIISASANGADSGNVLAHLDEWVIREKPAVVHFNCGIHDLKVSKQTKEQHVALAQYEANLRQIVSRLRKETSAALVFANTTPILDARHAERGGKEFDLFEADVKRYNVAALGVMREAGVPVDDLHWVVEDAGAGKILGADGTHYTAAGKERLAEAVADCVMRHWLVKKYTSPTAPKAEPSAEAAAKYRKAEVERDALVPPAYRDFKAGSWAMPASADAWRQQRPTVHKVVVDSLGDLPPRPSPPRARVVSRELRRAYTLERVAIDNGDHNDITALVLVPEKRLPRAPAILWLHSSTPDKNQLITPNSNGGELPLGEAFANAGYVVLAPDACLYGERATNGPVGPLEIYQRDQSETFRVAEDRLLKWNLWLGRTLWGMFVRDDQIALDYLCARPEVDAKRIGATGMSMGSTRAWWLAAVDERVAATVGVACLTRYQNLIAHGNLRGHGLYYFSYGLLKHFDTEGVLALMAPRPFLALTGDLDYGSPADGIKVLEEMVSGVYRATGAGENFKSILYPGVGHSYTPEMRAEMLAWFERWLKPAAQ
ncbi:MAG: dienelactone hydrolase family protein [Verrucomicrobia bacterium]|nr:dienelactone hydrolase family protein [Verrucomicrobiota bacterium]